MRSVPGRNNHYPSAYSLRASQEDAHVSENDGCMAPVYRGEPGESEGQRIEHLQFAFKIRRKGLFFRKEVPSNEP